MSALSAFTQTLTFVRSPRATTAAGGGAPVPALPPAARASGLPAPAAPPAPPPGAGEAASMGVVGGLLVRGPAPDPASDGAPPAGSSADPPQTPAEHASNENDRMIALELCMWGLPVARALIASP